jgi:AcrR family transcriptional regulator
MRTRIMSAALAELDEHGVRFTMSNLAARLSISKRTLYEHFESKEVLVESIVDDIIADLRVQRLAIVNNPDLDLKEKLIKMLTVRSRVFADVNDRVKLELGSQYPGLCKKAHKSQEEQWDVIDAVLKEGIRDGCFRPIFVPVLRKVLQGAVNEIIDYDFLLQQRTSFDEMIGHITDILIYGIMAPEKRA